MSVYLVVPLARPAPEKCQRYRYHHILFIYVSSKIYNMLLIIIYREIHWNGKHKIVELKRYIVQRDIK